jgi:hypothetical protein
MVIENGRLISARNYLSARDNLRSSLIRLGGGDNTRQLTSVDTVLYNVKLTRSVRQERMVY